MPTSSLVVVPAVVHHMYQLQPMSILDIGAGGGKYGAIFRECLPTRPRMVAIEGWEPYVDLFRLRGVYDEVHVTDVMLAGADLLNSCDAVYMGDVIEHLADPDGLTLLGRIRRPVVVCTPVCFFHNGDGLPWTETHRSHWTRDKFESTGRVVAYEEVAGGIVTTLGALPG